MCTEGSNPLLLISNGRSGSTLMMGYLSSHPGIVANTDYPMEVRAGQYYAHVAEVLLGRVTGNIDQFARTIVENKPWVTANPYLGMLGTKWINNEFSSRLVSLLKDAIRHGYYEEAEKQGKTAEFFAEKTLIFSKTRDTLMTMFPGYREIYLVRDPRAVFSSLLNFNKKRGFDGFDADKFNSPQEHIEGFVASYTEFRKRVEDGGELVRYEDLVMSPAVTLARVFSRLGIASGEATLQDIIKTSNCRSSEYIKSHATTSSALDSITSWKKTLRGEYLEAIEDRMGSLLDYFHYTDM